MRKTIPILALAAALTGCAGGASTLRELKADPVTHNTFKVEQNYEDLYRHLLSMSRDCFAQGMFGAQIAVVGDLSTRAKAGEIRVEFQGAPSNRVLEALTVEEVAPGASLVNVYTGRHQGGVKRWASVKRWALERADTCS